MEARPYNPWGAPIFADGAAFGTGSPAETSQQPSGLGSLAGAAYDYLGNLAKRAMGASANAVGTGTYNPGPALEAAMLPMGTGAVAGVPVRGAETVLGAGPIRAYHGSPHDFDKFDLSKIGTGEGAQAYGHGLYFAEKEGVAKGYRDALSNSQTVSTVTPRGQALYAAQNFGDGAAQWLQRKAASHKDGPLAQRFSEALDLLKSGQVKPGGRMYEVNINADPKQFLDWDKPFGQQSGEVREMLAPQRLGLKEAGPLGDRGWMGWTDAQDRLIGRATTKERPAELFDPREMAPTVYRGGGTWKPPEASDMLKNAGIPGIKYLDQGSRGAGQGSSNYVVFDDKLIDILKKYGLAGFMAPPIFAGATSEPKS